MMSVPTRLFGLLLMFCMGLVHAMTYMLLKVSSCFVGFGVFADGKRLSGLVMAQIYQLGLHNLGVLAFLRLR